MFIFWRTRREDPSREARDREAIPMPSCERRVVPEWAVITVSITNTAVSGVYHRYYQNNFYKKKKITTALFAVDTSDIQRYICLRTSYEVLAVTCYLLHDPFVKQRLRLLHWPLHRPLHWPLQWTLHWPLHWPLHSLVDCCTWGIFVGWKSVGEYFVAQR